MKKTTFLKVTASAVTSFLLFAGLTSTLSAQTSYEQDINSAARQLGLIKASTSKVLPPQPQKQLSHLARNQNTQQTRRPVRVDPYAAKRQQILRQNIARRKALQTRLANQKRQDTNGTTISNANNKIVLVMYGIAYIRASALKIIITGLL